MTKKLKNIQNKIMKFTSLFTLILLTISTLSAQITDPKATEVWEPEPRVVTTDKFKAPSDAIILFDGKNLDAWQSAKNEKDPAAWKIQGDHDSHISYMTVVPGKGDIKTKEKFGDIQLHLEFRTPAKVEADGQYRGNSGVFFQNRYEVQILDNYDNRTYSNGQAGAVYKQHIPLVNACKPPGTWQTYDIIFNAPRFNKDGIKIESAYVTVLHNGVLIQNHVEIKGTTEYIGLPKNEAHGDDSIKLQDHDNTTSFRNIWVRKL